MIKKGAGQSAQEARPGDTSEEIYLMRFLKDLKTFRFRSFNPIATIQVIRKGIGYEDFMDVCEEIPFTVKEWSDVLSISERTLQRYEKENKVFEPVQTEKIIHIKLLYNKGVDIFGTIEKFNTWLELPSIALGGNKPKDLLDSNIGIQLVNDELDRIEHGIFA